mmetsp:Transcript_44104/g.70808  ORF Transcript_44104/g.70808 Transcript_44104/m.70808 type:complete len:111 (-) Transcript_44104:413-745(-)
MVINVAMAALFGFFVIRYTNRHEGLMQMEYGQHVMKGLTETLNSSALVSAGEQLAALTGQLANGSRESQGGHASDRAHRHGQGRVDGWDDDDDDDDSASAIHGRKISNAV